MKGGDFIIELGDHRLLCPALADKYQCAGPDIIVTEHKIQQLPYRLLLQQLG
ncbi:hypothetical protein D3C72_2489580 [compost metagenome]